MKIIEGGVTAAKGFKAAAAAAEIKYKGRTDMAMVYSEVPCVAAGTFTTNVVKAAPVKWDQDIVYNHPSAQVVICNSGIANACTGAEGYGYCKETAAAAAEPAAAQPASPDSDHASGRGEGNRGTRDRRRHRGGRNRGRGNKPQGGEPTPQA